MHNDHQDDWDPNYGWTGDYGEYWSEEESETLENNTPDLTHWDD